MIKGMLAAFLLICQIPPKISYGRHLNGRFGFSLSVPTFLTRGQEPMNNDGMSWRTKDGKVILIASGMINIDERNAKEQLETEVNWAKKDGATKIYTHLEKSSFVLSFLLKGRIGYRRVCVSAATLESITFDYPASLKKSMDPIVKRVSLSFRPGF